MPFSDDDLIFTNLFMAAPEMLFEDTVIKYLKQKRLINDESIAFINSLKSDKDALARIRARYKGKPLFTRLLAISPEVLNPRVIGLLETSGLIKKNDADLLRVVLDRIGIVRKPVDAATLAVRARKLLGQGHVDEAINLLRSIDAITVKQANALRAASLGGRVSVETLQAIRGAKTALEVLQLLGSSLVDRRTIQALRVSGLISGKMAESLYAALAYGKAQWTVWEGAKRAEGLAARMAYVVSGSFSFEALEALSAVKELTPEQRALLEVAVQMSQRYNRVLMEQMTERKFRVVPGESPIVTYARSSQELESDLLKLLAKAADESRLAAARLQGAARGAEYALRAQQLHQAMRQVWEGTGYLTIFHEREVAEAAVSASEELMKKYYKHMTPFAQTMLEYQARSGLDSYISRKENTLELSRRVYGNLNVWTKKVDQQISLGLLQGESAAELAKRVTPLINPKVMGGVKYAAFRLGRTELANAFHLTTIRSTREMPWVKGYKWNRSKSHAHSDICDEYANDDHDGLGPGIFKKANVPGKPHPQCLCFLTIVGMDDDQFVSAYKAGRFDQYLATRVDNSTISQRLMEEAVDKTAAFIGRTAGQVALTQGVSLATRMMFSDGVRSPRPTPSGLAKARKVGSTTPASTRSDGRFFAKTVNVEAKEFKGSAVEFAADVREFNPDFPSYGEDFTALAKKEKLFNRANPNRSKIRFPGMDSFEIDSYENILDPELSNTQTPTLASTLYGTKAYRAINKNLRVSRGQLDKYDELFGDDNEMWNALADLRRADRAEIFKALEGIVDLHGGSEEISSYRDEVLHLFRDFDLSHYGSHSDIIRKLDSRMEPTNGDRFAYRVTGPEWFGLKQGETLTKDHIGLPFTDHGYTSFEGVKRYFKGSASELELGGESKRPYRVKAFLPDGTMATRVNEAEFEIVTSRGSNWFIIDVLDDGDANFTKTIHVMLGSQDHLPDWKDKLSSDDNTDFWDDVIMDF